MSSAAVSIPMFDTQGKVREIPQESYQEALSNGGKIATQMQDPVGKVRWVPYDQVTEGIKNGGKPIYGPLTEQKDGFWKSLGSDVWNMIPHQTGQATNLPNPKIAATVSGQQSQQQYEQEQSQRQQAGYGSGYRTVAPIGEYGLGVNVPGMEQAAQQGNSAAVMGHAAAVPTVMAGTMAAGELLSRIPKPIQTAPVRVVARSAELGVNKALKPLVGMMSPADEAIAKPWKAPLRDFGLGETQPTTGEPGTKVPIGKFTKDLPNPEPYKFAGAPKQMEIAQSTNIGKIGYNADKQMMTVEFKNGQVYSFKGVPDEIYKQAQTLNSADNPESLGSWFARNVKGRYETVRRGSVLVKKR